MASKIIRLRGDTAFSQTELFEYAASTSGLSHGGERLDVSAALKTNRPRRLDRWDDAKDVRFQFGDDAKKNLIAVAENLDESAWQALTRPARYAVRTKPRQKPDNVKRQVVRRREYEHLELKSEQVAEFDDQPTACQRPHRMVVIRKNISHEKGEMLLFDEIRYFFYRDPRLLRYHQRPRRLRSRDRLRRQRPL